MKKVIRSGTILPIARLAMSVASRSTKHTVRRRGVKFCVDLTTPAGLELYRFGVTDMSALHFARALRPGWHVIDGGANIGIFTLLAADRVGDSGVVRAVEASPETADLLEANVRVNGFRHVTVTRAALSDERGETEFFSFGPGAGVSAMRPATSTGKPTTVTTTTVESLVESLPHGRLDAMKLDLEGAEFVALAPCAAVLEAQRPILMLEVEPEHLARHGHSPQDIALLLEPARYDLFVASGPRRLKRITDLRRMPVGEPNVLCLPSDR